MASAEELDIDPVHSRRRLGIEFEDESKQVGTRPDEIAAGDPGIGRIIRALPDVCTVEVDLLQNSIEIWPIYVNRHDLNADRVVVPYIDPHLLTIDPAVVKPDVHARIDHRRHGR